MTAASIVALGVTALLLIATSVVREVRTSPAGSRRPSAAVLVLSTGATLAGVAAVVLTLLRMFAIAT